MRRDQCVNLQNLQKLAKLASGPFSAWAMCYLNNSKLAKNEKARKRFRYQAFEQR